MHEGAIRSPVAIRKRVNRLRVCVDNRCLDEDEHIPPPHKPLEVPQQPVATIAEVVRWEVARAAGRPRR